MMVNRLLGISAALLLALAPLPLLNVAAHTCSTVVAQAPTDIDDADTGCNGSSCPSDSGTLPHDHSNTVPPASCQNHGPAPSGGCSGKNHGQSKQHGGANGGNGPSSAQVETVGIRDLLEEGIALCHNGQAPALASYCPHSSPHSHQYGSGGSAGVASRGVGAGATVGAVDVEDTNTLDCNGDGVPYDFDGDYDTGVGGGFFGYGPWGHDAICGFGLALHGGTVIVNDAAWGSNVAFVVGADDTSGPDLTPDPVTGEPACTTSGSITPGDPSFDPTADADDCLTSALIGSGSTCGAGGDGGYWVFLYGSFLEEGNGAFVANGPTVGTITA